MSFLTFLNKVLFLFSEPGPTQPSPNTNQHGPPLTFSLGCHFSFPISHPKRLDHTQTLYSIAASHLHLCKIKKKQIKKPNIQKRSSVLDARRDAAWQIGCSSHPAAAISAVISAGRDFADGHQTGPKQLKLRTGAAVANKSRSCERSRNSITSVFLSFYFFFFFFEGLVLNFWF